VTEVLAVAALKIPAPSFAQFWEDESAQDLVEYALIATFVGLGTVTGVHGLAVAMAGYVDTVLSGFNAALSGHL
jgi:Flp pilus assembly pilin Flp